MHYLHEAYVLMRPFAYLLTYLHSWLWAYKTGNISETSEDTKLLLTAYKVLHGLSIYAEMYDLE